MIDSKDIKVDIINPKRKGMDVATVKGSFVRVEHTPTCITVTKYSEKSQLHARQEAFEEIEQLIELCNGRV